MAMAAALMSATVVQPRAAARPWLRLAPISSRFRAMIITTIRNGAAAMPLTVAESTSKVIGSIEVRVRAVPPTVPTASRT